MPPTLAAQIRTEELAPLCVRAGLSTIDKETRTVELTFTTGAAVRRYDFWNDRYYIEKLSLDPASVRLDRINAGAPLLDSHSAWSLASQIGVVEDGSAKLTAKRGTATVRFSKRAAVDPIFNDVVDRIIRNVSVGYAVYKYEETPAKKDGDLPIRTAIDWEPYEISMVPMPADPGAQTRDGKSSQKPTCTFPCEIIIRSAVALLDADRQRRFRLAAARH